MPSQFVLDEDDALELLAYLITAARTQVDEAAEYGPMRLLTAAHRLAEGIAPRSTAAADLVQGALGRMPVLALPRAGAGRDDYVTALDDLCRALATQLTARFAAEPGERG
ncbi:MAG: hypothetical protein QOH17_2425 [Pseudonocardiales bacterium]|jgi:hypothetical protein|nr:hypothetical protein [Pseudonocardiales bacterium]